MLINPKISVNRSPFERRLSHAEALVLADRQLDNELLAEAALLRDMGYANVVTYSPKVFIPLTQLCRDVCHYCTFAKTPKKLGRAFLTVEDVLERCRGAFELGCREVLFTLGEKPELRYQAARSELEAMGFEKTTDYLAHVAGIVMKETGLLPHINAGNLSAIEIHSLRKVSASMGLMLESTSTRLCEAGNPHHGSPDKHPAERIATIEAAGRARVPFTSGILIGIGETRIERIRSLLALRDCHDQYGHLQEIIIQNFRAKPGTKMSRAPEPDLDELVWTIAVARLIFGSQMSIQAPPNLTAKDQVQLVAAGINDWGGVSPLTLDYVNPEAPWPELKKLEQLTQLAGKSLEARLTVYPKFIRDSGWIDRGVEPYVLRASDSEGFARTDSWSPGIRNDGAEITRLVRLPFVLSSVSSRIKDLVARCLARDEISSEHVTHIFGARGADFEYILSAADQLRSEVVGDDVSFVVNRNINYTNVCYFGCKFCAFSKGKSNEKLRGSPYDVDGEEIARRSAEAWSRGATEVCLQGGIHPDYTGQTYIDILAAVRSAAPLIHIHAFSPLEVSQGAQTLGLSLEEFLGRLKAAGLGSLPGTAAEILDDEVRAVLCPDKVNTSQWLEVMEIAHRVGLRSTATIMFGHIERPRHWANHLLAIRDLQLQTGGFTEFVPLPFVGKEAPISRTGLARVGPSPREALLMHAVPRLIFNGLIDNIQTSWVKMGEDGVVAALLSGANDIGGTLMNESITRAAGAEYGQEWSIEKMESVIRSVGRNPSARTTLYGRPEEERIFASRMALPLSDPINLPARKYAANKKVRGEQMQTALL